jgi:hypothetical protein
MTKSLALVVSIALLFAPAAAESRQAAPSGSLKIVVIAGERAVNDMQRKTAVTPVVEVRDRNDRPVAGATVGFAFSGGKRAAFAGGVPRLIVTTDAAGRASAPLTPLSTGAVQIQVTASFGGQTATATISQTNAMTAPRAKTDGSSGSSGGGLSKTAIGQIAIAAGAAVFAVKSFTYAPQEDPPAMSWMVETSASGVSMTPCKSPAVTCELKLSDNGDVVQMHVDMTGIPDAENTLVLECGGCQMINGSGSQETYVLAPSPAHQTYVAGIQFPTIGVFPLRGTWTSRGGTVASFSILFTVSP